MKHNIRYSVQCVTNPLQNGFAWHLGGAGTKTSSNLHPPLQLIQGRPGCLNLGRPRHIDIVNDAVSLSLSLCRVSLCLFISLRASSGALRNRKKYQNRHKKGYQNQEK